MKKIKPDLLFRILWFYIIPTILIVKFGFLQLLGLMFGGAGMFMAIYTREFTRLRDFFFITLLVLFSIIKNFIPSITMFILRGIIKRKYSKKLDIFYYTGIIIAILFIAIIFILIALKKDSIFVGLDFRVI